jgi:hypothetical protein
MLFSLERGPAARLIRAREISRSWVEFKGRRYEDKEVLAYAKYLYDLNHLSGYTELSRYCALKPVLTEFHQLASCDPVVVDGRTTVENAHNLVVQKDRAVIRALILGGLPVEQLAGYFDYSQTALALYERMAWDVRSRRHKRAWVHSHLFGGSLYDETGAEDFDRLCQLMVYKYGVAALLAYLRLDVSEGEVSPEYGKLMRQINLNESAGKQLIAISSLSLNGFTAPQFISAHFTAEKGDREAVFKERQGGPPGLTDEDGAESALVALRQASLSVDESYADASTQLADAEVSQAEPRVLPIYLSAIEEVVREAAQPVAKVD